MSSCLLRRRFHNALPAHEVLPVESHRQWLTAQRSVVGARALHVNVQVGLVAASGVARSTSAHATTLRHGKTINVTNKVSGSTPCTSNKTSHSSMSGFLGDLTRTSLSHASMTRV
jgi:hypothetical protein